MSSQMPAQWRVLAVNRHLWLAVTALSLAGALSVSSYFSSRRATAEVVKTRNVVDALNRIRLENAVALVEIRDYLITGSSAHLAAVVTAQAAADRSIDALDRLTGDNTAEQARLAAFRHEWNSLQAFRRGLLNARGSAALPRYLDSEERIALNDAVVRRLDQVDSIESALLLQHQSREATSSLQLIAAIVLLLGVGLALGLRSSSQLSGETLRLAASEQRFRTVLESMSEGVALQDAQSRITVWNESAERILGLTGEQLSGRTSMDPRWRAIDLDGRGLPGDQHMAAVALRTGKPTSGTIGIERADGARVWLHVNAIPVFGPDRLVPAGTVTTFADITEQRATQQALAESESKYRHIVDTASEGICVLDPEGRCEFVNERLAVLLGYSVDEIVGRPASDFVALTARPTLAAELTRRRDGVQGRYDLQMQHRSGDPVWVMIASTPLRSASGGYSGALVMLTDVTERRHLESELRQAQKMEAMGRMAGGVAHDFNNLLTVIRSSAELMRDPLATPAEQTEEIEAITSSVERASALTAQLLAFCRLQHVTPQLLGVAPILRGLRPLIARLVAPTVSLSMEIDPAAESAVLKADPVQLEQVLINLAVNARDAMPGGGKLSIGCSTRTLEHAEPHTHGTAPAGHHLLVTVTDTGSGIPQDVVEHIFEPFFTTKPQGKGTGLGLATVYGIVKQAGGSIAVTTESGVGTTFTIYWPVVEGEMPVVPPNAATAAAPRRARDGEEERGDDAPPLRIAGRGTLLVVDDEEAVRRVLVRSLQHDGFHVVAAATGRDALEIVEHASASIAAIVTDVRMPGMTGVEMAQTIRRHGHLMPILFISGQLDTQLPEALIGEHASRFLPKPFALHELTGEVRSMLEAA